MARTLPAEIRKEQILTAARAVLSEKGFSQMRVSEVVEKAGLSQGSFYLHFPSKEAVVTELVRCMITEAVERIAERRTAGDDMETAVTATVRAYYEVCLEYRDVLESTAGGAAAGLDRGEWNQLYAPLNERALDLVRSGQARGEIDPAVDANIVSWLIIDTVNGAMERLFGRSGDRVSRDYERFILQWLLAALRGLRPPGAAARP